MKTFADHGIDIPEGARGPEVFLLCPKCSHTRRKKRVLCLSVNIEKGVWSCHHCEWSGGLKDDVRSARSSEQRPHYRKPDALLERVFPQSAADWFQFRAITDAVLSRNRVESRRVYMLQVEDYVEAVVFPYFRNGELVNLKYRAVPDKHFRLEPKCEVVLYGLDDIEPAEPLIWVEGEMDKLALEVAGFRHVVSVPNGAPPPDAKNYNARC
jgi:twinkle protein